MDELVRAEQPGPLGIAGGVGGALEEHGLAKALELYPDNILYETDYPHPTSMSVGPQSTAVHPREYASRVLAAVPDDVVERVLHSTAARIYGVT